MSLESYERLERAVGEQEAARRAYVPQLPAWSRYAEEIMHSRCIGDGCDLDAPCIRHSNIHRSATRWHRMRARGGK